MDWEGALRAVPLIVAALVSLHRFRDLTPRLRSRLKADLEILSKLDQNSNAHAVLKRNVEVAVERLYPSSGHLERELKPFDVTLGVFFVVGFGFWTAYIVKDGFSWWALLTGYFAVTGVGLLALGFGYGSKYRAGSAEGRDPVGK